MDWYQPFIKTAAKPPAYILERISDLKHVCDVAKTSPREANQILSQVVSQLSTQHDDIFVLPLKEAGRIMLDSPARATTAIEKVVAAMITEKEIQESEQEEILWKKKNKLMS